jgi:hypothetical protein
MVFTHRVVGKYEVAQLLAAVQTGVMAEHDLGVRP